MPDDDLIVKVSKVLDRPRATQMPDDVLVNVSKVSEKGQVQIPLEMREKLDLQPGQR